MTPVGSLLVARDAQPDGAGTWAASSDGPPPASEPAGFVEEMLNDLFTPVVDVIFGVFFTEVTFLDTSFPWIVAWVVLAGAAFSCYFFAVQIRWFGHAVALVRASKRRQAVNAGDPGEVTPFRALSAAVSATVGLGNIAGVAIAITIGGPGAAVWMVVGGMLSMVVKFVECTLGVKYREELADGTVHGGPMQYLRRGLAERGLPLLGRGLAGVYAVLIVLFATLGSSMFQINQTLEQLQSVTGGTSSWLAGPVPRLSFGIVASILIAVTLLGGMKSIGALAGRLVPAMTIVYLGACLTVIAVNLGSVPSALSSIVMGAISPEGVVGGVTGVMVVGFQRAVFSNEAGIGSSPMAHASVRTNHPATEGFVAMLGPCIDTVVVCTVTAVTIVIANPSSYVEAREAIEGGPHAPTGVTITSDAFATVLPWFPFVLAMAVILFAYSTIITWAHYGERGWTYFFGRGRVSVLVYRLLAACCTIAGSLLTLGAVLEFADALLFALALFNIIGLYLLAPVARREFDAYRKHLRSLQRKHKDRHSS
ncbi:amino acid carrier protein [Streptomyces olivoreticuli]|uniref:alanine/glycine:cation symporter family protein n=1 Tax=Streptomyces olivoreticuli TaxID=68246 RepID=UPI00265A3C94|nr:amino acid carrier protein [Streptomyces olivoreticuli]WKK24360.1 amino acid carrier protein [Streptomyces olivoreticuli]